MIDPGVVLIAIGGNALVHEGESGSLCRQQERSAAFARQVVELVEAGWRVLVTHGNGPQVGFILRRGELVAPDATVEGLPELPLWLAVADSQGGIGHLLCLAIDDALIAHDRPERAVAVLTHVEVDADDPAFGHPTKPIGGLLTADSARRRVAEEGWSVVETGPGVFRRVVPSPAPTAILEAAQVRTLTDAGAVVIAAGGGGIPLVSRDGQWAAVDAVVDKDRSSALLAARDRGRHDGAGHRRRRGLRRLRPADPACAARRHRGRDAGPPRRRAVPRGLDGPEGRVRAALRRGRRAPVDHHLARTPAGRTGRQGGHPHQRPPRPGACAVITVPADPSPYEFDPARTALVCIDFQRDFVEPGGFGETLGNDVSTLRPAIAPTERVLAAARDLGLTVIHTREGHRPDLADLFPAKRDRGAPTLRIGDEGPMGRILVRGSRGHDIIPELYPAAGEVVLDKPGKGAFYATDLETILRARGVTHLILTGVTTEVCVQTTAREANDRGFDCLVLADCTGSYFPQFHRAALQMISAQGGIVGWVADSAALLDAIRIGGRG